jgi:hypothetical protein
MYDAQGIYYVCVANCLGMIINIDFFFRGISLADTEKTLLSVRIKNKVQSAVLGALEPFLYNDQIEGGAWKVTLEGFPSGGYASKEQATLAVSL